MTMNQYTPAWMLKEDKVNNKLFVYGILKRGYELDLNNQGAKFIGEASIPGACLYGIGRPRAGREFSGVGLKLDVGPARVAHGELWDIPDDLWDWLDGIEQNGFCYTRKIVKAEHINSLGYPADIDTWVYEYTYPGFSYDNPIANGRF